MFSSKSGGGLGGRGGGTGSDDAGQGGWFRMFSVAVYKPYFENLREPRPNFRDLIVEAMILGGEEDAKEILGGALQGPHRRGHDA
ncbi:hypothetical protein GUJ93_ZPchr0006g44403 [Zizania palustris]|uniref:Uncharacterized protein n=1 Tax=Zizania palustris TaxID=103762 RepID=A0A8J5S753_ZIZPA|nr:hypothetical protein GUJ93_ZPchr0006g44403 [Zizania palustris]